MPLARTPPVNVSDRLSAASGAPGESSVVQPYRARVLETVQRSAWSGGETLLLRQAQPGERDRSDVPPSVPAPLAQPASAHPGGEAVPAPSAPPAPGSRRGAEVDELVEKAMRVFLRRLVVEGERRGWTRWP
ncbi:MAG: hypothetical protein M3281_02845 [Chloroflexota bacterium]|nr:hypothetical protein [Chloroflexota bacterium]